MDRFTKSFKSILILLVIISLPIGISAQRKISDDIDVPIDKTKRVSPKSKRLNLVNETFTYCDNDGDGFLSLDLNVIKNYVLSKNSSQIVADEGVYISTSRGDIKVVTSLNSTPAISQSCRIHGSCWGILDIALSQDKDVYISIENRVHKLTGCGTEVIYLFDRMNNLYFGGLHDSRVFRSETPNHNDKVVWHDFGSGYPSGDFVMYDDKMYIAWNNTNSLEYELLRVNVDANNNYVSHANLGVLPRMTFGLASELGVLYGVTPTELYKINIADFTFETVLMNDTVSNEWYGAAGKNEAVNKEEGLKVLIFDRFGKLIKSLGNNDTGWDGTYNSKPLPATDYWFWIHRLNGKVHKGHFALKR